MSKNNEILLVLNAGSSSLKFSAFAKKQKLLSGLIEWQGKKPVMIVGKVRQTLSNATLTTSLRAIQQLLADKNLTVGSVAHRIVHGGEEFTKPTKLTSAVIQQLTELVPLAPLHMPLNLAAVRAARQAWPNAEQWGVFDTAAFAGLADAQKLYALPLALAKRFHIRKYGFHGISHTATMKSAATQLNIPSAKFSGVTIHLGSGDSITAWEKGKPVDTSMGFTPLEGLTMSTRAGDLDPSIPLFLQRHGYTLDMVTKLLSEESGLYGLCGLRDMRDVLTAAGHPVKNWPRKKFSQTTRSSSKLALQIFVYDIQRYLASYLGLLSRPQAIVFTGSIGQNPVMRQMIQKTLPAAKGIRVLTLPTDEERAIAAAVKKW